MKKQAEELVQGTAESVSNVAAPKAVIPKKELWVFGIAALGQGMVFAIMSGFVTDFYITVLQTPLLFVLLLMLLARVWDACTDPMMGIIVDKFETKRGKIKPYIAISALPIAVFTILMFIDPGLGTVGNMVFAGIVFVLWGMIYTICDVPFWSLPNVMTACPKERGKVISFGRMLNGIGGAVPLGLFMILGLVLPLVLPDIDGTVEFERTRYMTIAVACTVVGISLFIISYFGTKERINIPVKGHDRGAIRRILKCRPLVLIIIMGVLSSGRYLMQVAAVHVARYAFFIGDISGLYLYEGMTEAAIQQVNQALNQAVAASVSLVTTIFTVCSAIGMFGAMVFMPKLIKKFNYKQIIIVTSIAGFVASLFTVLIGLFNIWGGHAWAIYALIPFIIIQCIPLGAINIISYAMIGDSLDYLELKTGKRDNALGAAAQGFINKLGSTIATCLVIAMYLIIALNPADMFAEQAVIIAPRDLTEMQRTSMFFLVSIIPGISLLLCAIPMFWYKLVGKEKDRVTGELAKIRKERGVTVEES